jgi:hypothetical protein
MLHIIPFSGGRPRFLGTEGAAASAATAAAAAAPGPGPGPGPAAHAASGAMTTATTPPSSPSGTPSSVAGVGHGAPPLSSPSGTTSLVAGAGGAAPAAGDDRASAPPGRRQLTAYPLRLSLTSVGPVPASARLVAALMSLMQSARP